MANNSKVEFNSLESCIIMLNYTVNHLRNIIELQDSGFDKMAKLVDNFVSTQPKKIQDGKFNKKDIQQGIEKLNQNYEIKKIKTIARIVHDYTVINLYNLLEIHPILVKHLNNMNEIELEKSLQDLWNPIQKLQPRIRKWRNKIIAHAEDIAKKHKPLYEIDEDYEQFGNEIFFATLCAVMYCSAISLNLPEYGNSIASHRRQIQYAKNSFTMTEWKNTHNRFSILTDQVMQNLKNNGYLHHIKFKIDKKYPRKIEYV